MNSHQGTVEQEDNLPQPASHTLISLYCDTYKEDTEYFWILKVSSLFWGGFDGDNLAVHKSILSLRQKCGVFLLIPVLYAPVN